MNNSPINLALVGATGVVGAKIIKLLEKKSFPLANFIPLGHSTVGNSISLNNEEYIVQSLESFQPASIDLIIFAAGSADEINEFLQCYLDDMFFELRLNNHPSCTKPLQEMLHTVLQVNPGKILF